MKKVYQSTYISDYDIEEWTVGEYEYELEPCISKKWTSKRHQSAKAIQQRRRGLKNHFKKLDN